MKDIQVWRINIIPASSDNADPRNLCIDNNILGVGWRVGDGMTDMDWIIYESLATEQYYNNGDRGWWPALNALHNRVKIGDLCWTRDLNGTYFLGQVTGDWKYLHEQESEYWKADIFNTRECTWVEIGDIDVVPGRVSNSFRGATLQRVLGDTVNTYSQWMYSKKSNDYEFVVPKNRDYDLYSIIRDEDCEDIIGVYLQVEHGFRIIPSTCKRSTAKTEFILKSDSGKKVKLQVKQGEILNPSSSVVFT